MVLRYREEVWRPSRLDDKVDESFQSSEHGINEKRVWQVIEMWRLRSIHSVLFSKYVVFTIWLVKETARWDGLRATKQTGFHSTTTRRFAHRFLLDPKALAEDTGLSAA